MSKYNLSCTIQNIQHVAIFELLEFFFLLQVKIKMLHKTYQGKASTVNNSAKY